MKQIVPILLCLFVFLSLTEAKSQLSGTGIVTGIVVERQGKPIPLVTVELYKFPDSTRLTTTSTREDGSFEWKGHLSSGAYFIRFSATGLKTFYTSTWEVSSNRFSLNIGRIILHPAPVSLAAVTVTARKPVIEQKPGMTLVNVESSVNAAGSTVMELLEKTPGVLVDREGVISLLGKSGVLVYIDGRPTYLSNNDLATMLRNLPADAVSVIEIITSPSAKYDAAGNAGVINIRTKRNRNNGTNGSFSLGTGFGKYGKANTGLMLNHRNKSWNLFGNYNYQYNRRNKSLGIRRTASQAGIETDFQQSNNEEKESHNHTFKLGADWQINKTSVIGLLINGSFNSELMWSQGRNAIGSGYRIDSFLLSGTRNRPQTDNNLVNINFKKKLDTIGAEWSVDADYGLFRNRENTSYVNTFLDKQMQPYRDEQLLRSHTPNEVSIKSIKSDISNVDLGWMKWEAGVKVVEVVTSNNMVFEQFRGQNWETDLSRTNDYRYEEQVLAAYMNSHYQLGKYRYQWGIRLEHTNSKGVSPTLQKTVKRKYSDLFPSILMTYAIGKQSQLSFSYNKRIQRPNYQTLNPFIYFLDQYGYMQGNPYLNPQYSHSMDLTYSWKGMYLVKAGATFTKGLISEVLLPDSVRKAIYQTFENLGSQKIYSLTISAPVGIGKWWTSQNNINGVYLHTQSDDLKGRKLDAGRFFIMANSNHNFSFGKGWNAEWNLRYTSTIVYSTVKIDPVFSMDVGVSKSVFKSQAVIRLSLADVFDTQEQFVQSVYPGFNYRLCQKPETRILRLGFSYRFGNKNVKASRNRPTGTESEQERLRKEAQ